MADYTPEIDSAYADIEEAGTAIILRTLVVVQSPADSAEPWKGNQSVSSSSQDQSTFGLWVSLSDRERSLTRVTEISRGILIPAKGLNPQPNTEMQIIANGITYNIVNVIKTIDFNGQPILHRVAASE